MLARVFVRDDFRAGGMQPCVAVGMIEVPMGVDQMRDRIGAEIGERLGELGRETPMPASTSSLPSGPVRTAMFPPEPSSTLTLSRSLWVTIGESRRYP